PHLVTVDVTGTNDAPTWVGGQAHLAVTTLEDTPFDLEDQIGDTSLTPNDLDDDGPVLLTLEVTDGILIIDEVMAASLGVTVASGNNTRKVVLEGPRDPGIDDLLISSSGQLSGVTYQPDPNFHGTDQLLLTVNDQGDHGVGPAKQATKIIDITVTAVNDAPVITLVPGESTSPMVPGYMGQTVVTRGLTETDAPLTTSGTLTVSDVDIGDTVSAEIVSVTGGGAGYSAADGQGLLTLVTPNPVLDGTEA